MGSAPITGFIIQPIIGYFSDKTWNRLGRHAAHSFCLVPSAASLALFIMPIPTLGLQRVCCG